MRTRRRVLIVDDEAEWAERAKGLLPAMCEWDVTYVTGCRDALSRVVAEADWDLLMVDYQLEDGSGEEVVRWARRVDRNVPIGLMSSFNKDAIGFSRDLSVECSTMPFLSKSFIRSDPDAARQAFNEAFVDHMQERCDPCVRSEWGRMRAVMVHEPGVEVSLLDPDRFGDYLFEARLDDARGAREHRAFVELLRRHDGAGSAGASDWMEDRPLILQTAQLLFEVVRALDRGQREELVCELLFGSRTWAWLQLLSGQMTVAGPESKGLYARPPKAGHGALERMITRAREVAAGEPAEIVRTVMAGLALADLVEGSSDDSRTTWDGQVVKPIPNLYFMRDPAFVLGNTVFVGQMYWPVRERETALMKAIFTMHPFFGRAHEGHRVHVPDAVSRPGAFREGGDAMAVGGGAYAIGLSERTTREAVRSVAAVLFENDESATHVYQPVIPQRAEMMHLDTVCSLVGPEHFLTYPAAAAAYADTLVWTRDSIRSGKEPESLGKNFVTVLEERFGRKRLLVAGGGMHARVEQRYDAANVLMVNPRRVVVYSANRHTNEDLRRTLGDDLVVSELEAPCLVVGRGGPRCMTMPIQRD